jgi:hypothetical protein
VSSEDLANPIRQDLRHLCVFSVDPPGMLPIDSSFHFSWSIAIIIIIIITAYNTSSLF